MEIQNLTDQLEAFAVARGWKQFHSPKNLAMALNVETSELLEVFQWLTPEQSISLNPQQRFAVEDEIADVMAYLLYLSSELGIDPVAATQAKIERNETRFPKDG